MPGPRLQGGRAPPSRLDRARAAPCRGPRARGCGRRPRLPGRRRSCGRARGRAARGPSWRGLSQGRAEGASSFAARRYALASSVTIISRPEFLRRLFNPGDDMRAIEFHGDEQLEIGERPDPSPGEGQLLIEPTGVGICGTDIEIFEGSLAYFRMGIAQYPIVPGHEWTGTVVDVGPGVTGFFAGDRVVGEVAIGCGVCVRCLAGRAHLGARRPETGIVHMDGAMASHMVFPALHAHRVELEPRAGALVEP